MNPLKKINQLEWKGWNKIKKELFIIDPDDIKIRKVCDIDCSRLQDRLICKSQKK